MYCSDGEYHMGISLITNMENIPNEDLIEFIFHPVTGQLVKNWLDCPIISKEAI